MENKYKRDVTAKAEDKKADEKRYCKVSGINREEENERAGSMTRCSEVGTRGKEGWKERRNEQEEL